MSDRLVIELDPSVYSADAVLATAYWYANKCVITIIQSSPSFSISITPRADFIVSSVLLDDINVRLVQEELRVRLRKQFAQIETAIVQKAFAAVRDSGQGV